MRCGGSQNYLLGSQKVIFSFPGPHTMSHRVTCEALNRRYHRLSFKTKLNLFNILHLRLEAIMLMHGRMARGGHGLPKL
jgi:gluconate kinase